ncbi:MAG TPA: hypothetical protein VEF71_06020, partial [Streptosporangiaceae bacterium]|nr:hypothetical protein [Streptosporangiaceae bacterium]
MNTSGVAEPPEISVASVARFVSVFVGADTSVTWIFGYAFSNALISTVRVSPYLVVVIGLADHTIVVDVVGAAVADDAGADVLLVVLLLLQPAAASAPAAATAASSQPRRPRGYLSDLARTMEAP